MVNCDIFILNKKHIFSELKGKKEKGIKLIYKLFKRAAKERLKKLKLAYTNGMHALKLIGMNEINQERLVDRDD
jgi:hypothetical protein